MKWRVQPSELIQKRTGVEIPPAAPQLLVMMRERMDSLGLDVPSTYINLLSGLPVDDAEWRQLIQGVTNHLTHFFRDAEQLSTLVRVLEALERCRSAGERLRIWSAGCATGEEVYTLAILGHQRGMNLEVHGSDVSRHALETARGATYEPWSLRHVEPEIVQSCFETTGAGGYRVRREIARRAHFHEHNLVRDPPLAPRRLKWDVIICRNVLIYYSPSAVRTVLTGFANALSSDGALLLGASESILRLDLPLRVELVEGRVVYYRRDEETTTGRSSPVPPRFSSPPAAFQSPAQPPRPRSKAPRTSPASYIEVQPDLLSMVTEGKLDDARTLLEAVVQTNEVDEVARLSLGHVHLLQHDFDRARDCYQQVAERDPLVAEAHYFLGVVERRTRRPEAAYDALRRAVFLEPRFWAASYLLGATARRLGKHAVCKTECERTISLLTSGEGELPLITHPALHARFLDSPDLVLQACRGHR